jgi:hypothetical protein
MEKAEVFFMITLTKGNTTETIYCTPLELLTSAPNYYYFKFTNRLTKQVVSAWLSNVSTTDRFQRFTIQTNSLFSSYDEGFWTYTIQPSTTNNLVPTTAICESGLMYLKPNNSFTPTKYDDQSTTFKTYS